MNLQLLPSLTSLPLINLIDEIRVNPAHTWETLCGVRDPNKLTTIVVHHDAMPKDKYTHLSDSEYASRIADGHMGIKTYHKEGDPGNPYHVMVRSGRVYQLNNLLAFTYGVPSNNGYTVHVCVAGEYRYTDTMTDEDYNMLVTVIVSLLSFTELPNLKIVKGHRELSKTECPGIDLGKLREDVLNVQKQVEYAGSKQARDVLAYTIAQEILWTYNIAKGIDQYGKPTVDEGTKEWAKLRLLLLEPVMREHGFLQ